MANGITRRLVVALLGGTSIAALLSRRAIAAVEPAARLIVLADLHSAYGRLGQLLAALEAEIGRDSVPVAILLNGDVFEFGNVVTTRSAGAIDWAFLNALSKLAPVILNIGNHEPDLDNDLSDFVRKARALGITVVTNITDTRSGRLYADATATLQLGAVSLAVMGVATNALNTYPQATRAALGIPEPAAWVAENLATIAREGMLPVVLSHAGVVADRAILPLLPDGALLVGGHDHLLLTHEAGRTRYFHTGSWAAVYTIVDLASDGALTVRQRTVDPATAPSGALGALISATLAEHLTEEEASVLGESPQAMTLAETGRSIAATMAAAVGANAGFIGHTTLGGGFPAGPVSKYAFDAIVRFDGKLMTADVDAAAFAQIIALANQDGPIPLAKRTGDFLYSAPAVPTGKATVRIVTNDWSATNQQKYFGRDDLVFAEVPDLRLKAVIASALRK